MLLHPTLFLPSAWTPPAPGDGIFLGEPVVLGEPGAERLWIHGVLSLAATQVPAASRLKLPRSVFVSLVTEAGQLPGIQCAVADRSLFDDPVAAIETEDRGPVLSLPFSIDAGAAFGGQLLADAHYVHVSSGRFHSAVHRFFWPASETPDTPGGSVESLLRAYGDVRRDEHGAAASRFASALASPSIAADFDGAHFYNAACAASRAAVHVGGAERAALEAQAFRWLREELGALKKRVGRVEADRNAGREQASLRRRHEALLARQQAARALDRDLDRLRASPEWARLSAEKLL